MAGEVRGELAEAIAVSATKMALQRMRTNDTVFWEAKPSQIPVVPDVAVGKTIDEAHTILLVTACDAPKNFAEKFWRNLGEQFDAKSRMSPRPRVVNLVFLSEIKPELLQFTEALSDHSILVDKTPGINTFIPQFLDETIANAPSKKGEKLELVSGCCERTSPSFNPNLYAEVVRLSELLEKIYTSNTEKHVKLWQMMARDIAPRLGTGRGARQTMLRRGIARWCVFSKNDLQVVLDQHLQKGYVRQCDLSTDYCALSMLEKKSSVLNAKHGPLLKLPDIDKNASNMVETTAGDLHGAISFFLLAAGNDPKKAQKAMLASAQTAPAYLHANAALLRAIPGMARNWHSYICANWLKIKNPYQLFLLMQECRNDPSFRGSIDYPEGVDLRVWVYDHLIALLRSQAQGKNNEYGYNFFVSRFKKDSQKPELKQLLKRVANRETDVVRRKCNHWAATTLLNSSEPGRRGFQDWLACSKELLPVIPACFAYAISKTISELDVITRVPSEKYVAAHSYSIWNKLLTYPDFEPLAELVATACGGVSGRGMADTMLRDLHPSSVQDAGRGLVFRIRSTVICWKSAYGNHAKDKKKELGAKVRALRFRFKGGAWVRVASKFILVVDGDFSKEDLGYLFEAGWDEIFYPDEMDKLAKAIV